MSPASAGSGALEVEKYIGACLISRNKSFNNNHHHHHQRRDGAGYVPDFYQNSYDGRFRLRHPNYHHHQMSSGEGWAGGVPLISFANHQRRPNNRRLDSNNCNDLRNGSPLSQLAVHTQGAPLILTKTWNHRRNNGNKNQKGKIASAPPPLGASAHQLVAGHDKVGAEVPVGDAVSVTSDESSGSTNSDNCLPRIIKPRKRRKKERKPQIAGRPSSRDDGFSTDSASPDIVSPAPYHLSPFLYRLVPDSSSSASSNSSSSIASESNEDPQLLHKFEDVEDGVDVNGNQPTTVCQCRYCDPAGQIWDVDRDCYSPFLTAPSRPNNPFVFPDLNLNGNSNNSHDNKVYSPFSLDDSFCLLVRDMSSVSLNGDAADNVKRTCGDLEVSTEIVTSANGHRDLEIKFYSSSPNTNKIVDRSLINHKTSEVLSSECS